MKLVLLQCLVGKHWLPVWTESPSCPLGTAVVVRKLFAEKGQEGGSLMTEEEWIAKYKELNSSTSEFRFVDI